MEKSSPRYRYRRLGADFWRRQFMDWEQSGQTKVAFCEAQGLNVRSFYRWCTRFSEEESSQARFAKSSFVELKIATCGAVDRGCRDLELHVPEGCLRIPSGFDRQSLIDVLEVLEGRWRC